MGKLHIGLSGYSYKPWQGEDRFYPPEIKQRDFLSYYATRFETVELDGTWYRMPSDKQVQDYLTGTPGHFSFCFKMHRNVTHVSRLKHDCQDSVKYFLGKLKPVALAGRLGPVLIQLPPNLKRNDERLVQFLDEAPKAIPEADEAGPVRYAVEFRNETWHAPEVEQILRERNVAWVASDTDEAAAQRRDTAEFVYARLRRTEYDTERLLEWKGYFEGSGRECFIFCKHEDDGHPWVWADCLLGKSCQSVEV